MKKKAAIFLLITPLIYLYGLAENHFSFGKSIRGYTLDFGYEYINAWRILFGKDHKDNSVKVALYEYKLKAKKAKVDMDIALKIKELYGTWHIRFSKDKRRVQYYRQGEYGSENLSIKQVNKDRFKIEYYNDTGWNKTRKLSAEYTFTKEQTLDIIQILKEKKYF